MYFTYIYAHCTITESTINVRWMSDMQVSFNDIDVRLFYGKE